MGAWIETVILTTDTTHVVVAPYVGAWIETLSVSDPFTGEKSHPTWVRGLKPISR